MLPLYHIAAYFFAPFQTCYTYGDLFHIGRVSADKHIFVKCYGQSINFVLSTVTFHTNVSTTPFKPKNQPVDVFPFAVRPSMTLCCFSRFR